MTKEKTTAAKPKAATKKLKISDLSATGLKGGIATGAVKKDLGDKAWESKVDKAKVDMIETTSSSTR